MENIKLYDKVKIKRTNEIAVVVDINSKGLDSYILEKVDKNEMPKFYKRADFEKIEE